jgi:peroxiredoxin
VELGFDVVELPPHGAPSEGEEAPDFVRPLVNDEYWEDTALSEVAPALLVFYPMNGSFPATYIWQGVRDRGWTDEADVVGVTVSTPYSHRRFLDEYGVAARLFADPSNGVAREYGLEHDLDGMEGIEEPRPAVFAVDDDMTVEYAWVAEEHPEFPPYEEVGEAIEGL